MKEKLELECFSVENALDSVRSDLNIYDNPKANAWKGNCKSILKSFLKKSRKKEMPSHSTYNTTNNSGSMLNNSFSGDIIASSQFYLYSFISKTFSLTSST